MINRLKKIKRLVLNSKGFTLIETLVAVLLLSTAIVGPLTIAAKGMQATLIAKDQDSAFYLAQDAVEYVRWVRDTNKLSGSLWLNNLGPCISTTGNTQCIVDSFNNTAPTTCSGSCPAIKYSTTNNYFTNAVGVGAPSIFTRSVSIKNDPAGATPNEATVTVVVSWIDQSGKNASITRSVTVRENIFNWQ